MILGVLSAEARASVPDEVLRVLGAGVGDQIAYVLDDDGVRLARADAAFADPFANPFATFTEWAAYDNL